MPGRQESEPKSQYMRDLERFDQKESNFFVMFAKTSSTPTCQACFDLFLADVIQLPRMDDSQRRDDRKQADLSSALSSDTLLYNTPAECMVWIVFKIVRFCADSVLCTL